MERTDADGDGKISQAEWKGPADAFLQIDADADGFLSAAELAAARASSKDHPRHGPMDTNGDGWVSRAEWDRPSASTR